VVYRRALDLSSFFYDPAGFAAYRYDRQTQTSLLVSPDVMAGGNASGVALTPRISDNGRYTVFVSPYQLTADDNNAEDDIYRYDVQTNTLLLVSVDSGGNPSNGDSGNPWMDGSGDLIAFDSVATDLVAGDSNARRDVFLRTLSASTTVRVSLRSNGNQSNGDSFALDLSDDGNMVLFSSLATNLDSSVADSNGVSDVFRHNLSNGATRRATLDATNLEFSEATSDGAISADGQFVVFTNRGGISSVQQVWRKNLTNDNLVQVTNSAGGASNPDLSEDGSQVCFSAGPRAFLDLDTSDSNGRSDIYRASISTAPVVVTVTREGLPATAIASAVTSEVPQLLDIDDAGTKLLISTPASQIDQESFASYPTARSRLYLQGRFSGAYTDLCGIAPGTGGDAGCSLGALSGNGQYAFFVSSAQNLHPDTAGVLTAQIYRKHLGSGALDVVTRNTSGFPAINGGVGGFDLDANFDGSRLTFFSVATDLVAGDSNGRTDAFVWDTQTGIRRVSIANGGAQANADPFQSSIRISNDGDRVFFAHEASNLVGGDSNGVADIFMYTLSTSSIVRVAQPPTQATSLSTLQDVTPDGRYVALFSEATQFPFSASANYFVWDRIDNSINPVGADVLAAGALSMGAPVFDRASGSVFFSVGDDANYPNASTVLYRQFIEQGTSFEQGRAATDPLLSVPPLRFATMQVASDRAAFVLYNQSLDVDDHNGIDDLFEVASGKGYAAFGAATLEVPEGAGTIQIGVTRSHGVGSFADISGDIASGSAVAGSDFIAAPNLFFAWSDGQGGTQNASIQIVDDTLAESSETFTITLSEPAEILIGSPAVLTITILDNDGALFANGFE